jgi:hypothetical protein
MGVRQITCWATGMSRLVARAIGNKTTSSNEADTHIMKVDSGASLLSPERLVELRALSGRDR